MKRHVRWSWQFEGWIDLDEPEKLWHCDFGYWVYTRWPTGWL